MAQIIITGKRSKAHEIVSLVTPNASAIDARLEELTRWLDTELGLEVISIAPASADASFRRYFRVQRAQGPLIVMDAPPERENIEPYLRVTGMLLDIGVHVPRILEQDRARGFLLLSDLGRQLYLPALQAGRDVDRLYDDALAALLRIQARGGAHAAELPPYDRSRLEQEMQLLPEWFFERHLQLTLEPEARGMLRATFEFLLEEVLAQPRVFVHRDYHSRNLMICPDANPGILDFQDAVAGAGGLRPGVAPEGSATSRGRARACTIGCSSIASGCACRRRRRGPERCGVPALVRSRGCAAAPQGARHLRAPLAPRRQARLSRRSARTLEYVHAGDSRAIRELTRVADFLARHARLQLAAARERAVGGARR